MTTASMSPYYYNNDDDCERRIVVLPVIIVRLFVLFTSGCYCYDDDEYASYSCQGAMQLADENRDQRVYATEFMTMMNAMSGRSDCPSREDRTNFALNRGPYFASFKSLTCICRWYIDDRDNENNAATTTDNDNNDNDGVSLPLCCETTHQFLALPGLYPAEYTKQVCNDASRLLETRCGLIPGTATIISTLLPSSSETTADRATRTVQSSAVPTSTNFGGNGATHPPIEEQLPQIEESTTKQPVNTSTAATIQPSIRSITPREQSTFAPVPGKMHPTPFTVEPSASPFPETSVESNEEEVGGGSTTTENSTSVEGIQKTNQEQRGEDGNRARAIALSISLSIFWVVVVVGVIAFFLCRKRRCQCRWRRRRCSSRNCQYQNTRLSSRSSWYRCFWPPRDKSSSRSSNNTNSRSRNNRRSRRSSSAKSGSMLDRNGADPTSNSSSHSSASNNNEDDDEDCSLKEMLSPPTSSSVSQEATNKTIRQALASTIPPLTKSQKQRSFRLSLVLDKEHSSNDIDGKCNVGCFRSDSSASLPDVTGAHDIENRHITNSCLDVNGSEGSATADEEKTSNSETSSRGVVVVGPHYQCHKGSRGTKQELVRAFASDSSGAVDDGSVSICLYDKDERAAAKKHQAVATVITEEEGRVGRWTKDGELIVD